jgi:hypothetical protein
MKLRKLTLSLDQLMRAGHAHVPRGSAAGVPYPVLSAVLWAAIGRSVPRYAGR